MEGGSWVWIPAPPPGFILNGKKLSFRQVAKIHENGREGGGGWWVALDSKNLFLNSPLRKTLCLNLPQHCRCQGLGGQSFKHSL